MKHLDSSVTAVTFFFAKILKLQENSEKTAQTGEIQKSFTFDCYLAGTVFLQEPSS